MSEALARATALTARLRATLSTVHLATTSADGEPDASIAAALLDADGAFVIYISGLAVHTHNLRAVPRASVLLIETETATPNPFARPRLTFACTAEPIPREAPAHTALVAAFRAKFGPTIDVVATLPDFQFIRLLPHRGRVVAGFGAAFEVNPRDWSQLTPFGRPGAR